MASRKTLTVDNLVTLGTERLATMLVELAEDSPEINRRLRLELAAAEGGEAIAAEIGKRIVALKAARSFVDWQKRREFVKALDLQRAMIVDRLAPTRPDIMDGGGDNDWEEVYIEALDADGQIGLAQQLRWAGFEQRLSATRLRAYLKRLPDFEDFEAERRALRHALGYRSFATALHFLHEWPDPAGAAQLVLARHAEIDGNLYYLLDSAARQIEDKHPLAATLLRRAMIEDTLSGAKSTRYKHAARHLLECRSLATSIADHAPFETHEAFVSRLRAKHGRKSGFWSLDAALTDARS